MEQIVRGADNQLVEICNFGNGPVEIDTEIAYIVKALNQAGIKTIASCSGHGHRPGSIILEGDVELLIMSYEEARKLDRLWPDIHSHIV